MIVEESTLLGALQRFFGYESFKGEQEAIIKNVLEGNDTFVIMPTGGGKSMCYDLCAANWPPLMAEGSDKDMGKWTVVKRDDGKAQWAYDGKPLYSFVMDKKPGDMTGEGKMDGAWKVAKSD